MVTLRLSVSKSCRYNPYRWRRVYGNHERSVHVLLRREVTSAAGATGVSADRKRRGRLAAARTRRLFRRERELWVAGSTRIAGVDEAGVGPLAGPVVAAAVLFDPGTRIEGVDDSKVIVAARREVLARRIRESALAWSVVAVEPDEIDRLNIYRATLEAMRRAVIALQVRPDHVLVDARTIPGIDLPQEGIVRGDANSHAIAAASILAKTTRDARMCSYDSQYPGYGFAEHKGYPTSEHREAIRRLGPCAIHRRSFALLPHRRLFD
jgi:ribonuclease HII